MDGKKIEGEYSWDKIIKIQREIGLFTGELIFCYPSRIDQNLAIAKSNNNGKDLDACRYIIKTLQAEAEGILKSRGYPTDLKDLESIRDYDQLTGKEADADIQILNAKQVLISSKALKEIINTKRGALVFFDTLKLLAASITAAAQRFTLQGINTEIGQDKSHTKGKLKGLLLAIEETRQASPDLAKRRNKIWDHFRHLDKAGTPWTQTNEGVTYRITFRDKDTLVLTTATKKGEEAKSLKRSTFIQKYCTTQDREQNESAGCDENGMPFFSGHPWNKQKTAGEQKNNKPIGPKGLKHVLF